MNTSRMPPEADATTPVSEITPKPKHPELARRIYIAVASYKAQISYATMEKRLEESGEKYDPSWNIVAENLYAAVTEAVSERLRSMFS